MCRAGEELKRVMDHGDFEFWGFKKAGGHYDVINRGQRKIMIFSIWRYVCS